MSTSLVGRVGFGAVATSIAAALVSSIATGVVTVSLVRERDERRLREAATVLALEIDEEVGDKSFEMVVADEQHEMEHTGLVFAVIDASGARLAGSPRLPTLRVQGCGIEGGMRACATLAKKRVWVVAGESQTDLGKPLLAASTVAVLLAGVLGWGASRRLARWLVSPLLQLRDRVARIDPRGVNATDLGDKSGLREVDVLHESLALLMERVDAAIRTAERFAIDASHELRTPLTTIRGELDLMLETSAPARPDLERVRIKVLELHKLTERLLLLALPTSGTWTAPDLVGLDDLVNDTVAEMGVSDRITLASTGANPAVRGDATLLSALVVNAIGNALKFGTRAVITVRSESAQAVLEVSDDGPGVPVEMRERVFEPFFRDPAHRRVPGQGLGLAVVANVALRHGGRARFIDSVSGARLEVTLPLASQTDGKERASPPS